ncbi:MAG: hypothetical protein ACI81V_000160 [Lentimonas sp.]|jgi:hypothetical protein
MSQKKKFAWSLWIPVTLAFIAVIIAWATLIKIVHDHPTPTIEVPTP